MHLMDGEKLISMKDYVDTVSKHLDEMRISETRRIDEHLATHAAYEDKLADAEKKRLDAIRSVDVAAVSTASERAAAQALLLAKNVSDSADNLRKLVDSTAISVAEQLKSVSTQLTDRLALLEKKQYENQGKSSVTDPQIEKLFTKIDGLVDSRSEIKGTGLGRKEMYGWIVGAIMTIIAILSALKLL